MCRRGVEFLHSLTRHFLTRRNTWFAQRCKVAYNNLKNVSQNNTNWSKILIRYHPLVSDCINMSNIKTFYILPRVNFIVSCESQKEQELRSIEWLFLQCRRNVFTVRYEINLQNKFSLIFEFKILRYTFSFIRNTKRITYKKRLRNKMLRSWQESSLTL